MIYDDAYLAIAPAWPGWSPIAQGLVLAILLIVPFGLVIWLSRLERRLISPGKAWLLLGLRLVGVGLVWSLLALQPRVVSIHREDQTARLLLALDASPSMTSTDPQREMLEKLRLARLLKLAPPGREYHPALMEEGIHAFLQGEPLPGELAPLLHTLDSLPRYEIVNRLLTGFLWEDLTRHHQAEAVGFHQSLWELSAPPAIQASSDPGTNTDLKLPLQQALKSAGQGKVPLAGVVLISDGQHNQGGPWVELAQRLGQAKIPIFPLAVGSRQAPLDVALVDIQAPPQVFKDAEATVEARVRVQGTPRQNIDVELKIPSLQKFQPIRKNISHDGRDQVHVVSFPLKPDEVGLHRLELTAKLQNDTEREASLANNRLATLMRVATDKIHVLLVDGEARWEVHYLAGGLRRDPDIQLDTVLFDQPRLGSAAEEKLEKLGLARLRLPETKDDPVDPLHRYDCILLGDIQPQHLGPADRERLEKYVGQHGGTLIFLAGKRFLPSSYLPGENDPLARLLPLTNPRPITEKDGFSLKPSEEGQHLPIFQFEENPEDNLRRWNELPKHYWGMTGKPRPGASVLAGASTPGKEGLILLQNYGFGKVLYVGIDSTWRWRFRRGDADHHRFWGQVVRWAGSDAWLAGGQGKKVRFGSRLPVYAFGQPVDLLMRLGSDASPPEAGAVRIRMLREGEAGEELHRTVELRPGEHRKDQWETKVAGLPPGNYRLELDMPGLEKESADQSPGRDRFTVLPPTQGELVDQATHWDLLQRLAEVSGGRVFALEEADHLAAHLARRVETTEQRLERKFWQDDPFVWWLLSIFLGLFSVEWLVRKWAGLP